MIRHKYFTEFGGSSVALRFCITPICPLIQGVKIYQFTFNRFLQSDCLRAIGVANTRGKHHARLIKYSSINSEVNQICIRLSLSDPSGHWVPSCETQVNIPVHSAPTIE